MKKNLNKFLKAAKKVEVRQVARKAADIAEISAFNKQYEHYRHDQFISMLDDEECLRKAQQDVFDPFQEAEEERVAGYNDDLLTVQTFESETLQSRQYAEGNDFDTIAEMQGFDFEETRPHAVKQLPTPSSDVFVNPFTDVTENHLEEELIQNTRAITPWKEKVRTALIPLEKSSASQNEAPQQTASDTGISEGSELSEEQIRQALKQEQDAQEPRSSKPGLYFRPTPKKKT